MITAPVRAFAAELLPVAIALYPTLLLLDDFEPGFVRSVFNPHWGLPLVVAVAVVAGNSAGAAPRWSPRSVRIAGIGVSMVTALWMWWKLGGGILGATVAAVAGVVVVAAAWMTGSDPDAASLE